MSKTPRADSPFPRTCAKILPMPIHILPDDLASKIAAGEVIERPASVVKELIENSIDAGAREIKIEIRGGGQRLIRVADDGCGIPAAEVATAFARHATSKLDSVDDLFRLQTLGFRGEALPSIAAVARVTLITRARGEEAGTQMRVDGGKVVEQRAQGAPSGTIVTVEDLFRHVPARLKFLKTPATEAGRIADLINAYALAYPALRFSLVNDERLLFQSPGTGKMFDALVKVFGIEIANQMVQVQSSANEQPETSNLEPRTLNLEPETITVAGYIASPSVNRATRKYMFFFVNHRWVQDRTLQHAVIEAYHTALMVGRAPIVALDIALPPDAVDVNVHPTKSEVRFRDTSAVFRAVQHTVRATLVAHAPIPTISVASPFALRPNETQLAIDLHRPLPTSNFQPPTANVQSPITQLPMLCVLGQILSTYIIAEGPDGLYLIDQHSAHERVLYEQLMAERASATIAIQELLDPLTLQLTPAQSAALETHRDALAAVGFKFEEFGAQTILLRAIPAVMKKSDPRDALARILDELEQGETPLEKSAEARLISSVCKSIAVKGGQVLSLEEMRELVRRLEQTTAPRTCPHGRPTMIQLNIGQLEREFGRK
ncbi:MAG: DNA mismatch repair endonuclease MutL [Anaerolineales bacterium]|nr:DNA mismatch repair endonuclease MutL [Anaerolineales bacterium]